MKILDLYNGISLNLFHIFIWFYISLVNSLYYIFLYFSNEFRISLSFFSNYFSIFLYRDSSSLFYGLSFKLLAVFYISFFKFFIVMIWLFKITKTSSLLMCNPFLFLIIWYLYISFNKFCCSSTSIFVLKLLLMLINFLQRAKNFYENYKLFNLLI